MEPKFCQDCDTQTTRYEVIAGLPWCKKCINTKYMPRVNQSKIRNMGAIYVPPPPIKSR